MNKRRKGEKTKALFNCILFTRIILWSYQNPHRVCMARGKPGKSWKIIITKLCCNKVSFKNREKVM